MKIDIVTSNKQKAQLAAETMAPFGIEVSRVDTELVESRSLEPAEIALEKASQAFRQIQRPLIVEDSGFFIRALNGFPKTHIKFSLQTLGIERIMKMMEGETDRHAEWRSSVAYVSPKGESKVFTFIEEGEIAKEIREERREKMSDYWRIYIPKMLGNSLTLSEMSDKAMARWHDEWHKNNHFVMLARWLSSDKK